MTIGFWTAGALAVRTSMAKSFHLRLPAQLRTLASHTLSDGDVISLGLSRVNNYLFIDTRLP